MIRVSVIGATGYAGAEIVRILCGHPEATLTILTSRQYAGVNFADVYPLNGRLCQPFVRRIVPWIVFVTMLMLCLPRFPHKISHGVCTRIYSARQEGHRPVR